MAVRDGEWDILYLVVFIGYLIYANVYSIFSVHAAVPMLNIWLICIWPS